MSRSHRIVTSSSPPTSSKRGAAAQLFVAFALVVPVSLAGCGALEDLIDDLHHGGGSVDGGGGSVDGGATGPTCGGIAGKPCPGMGKCVDNPNDSCDPAKGGADCGGICSCIETVLCTKGSKFDSSPSVCACVPEVTPPPATTCGGFTGKACPGMGKCVDDPSDSCDPTKGGADCGGICSCIETVLCTKGSKFDSSPSVCACVPEKPVCGPVCLIYCPFGNVLDSQGCPTCACNKPTPGATCPTDQCTGPGPKSANFKCPDGKTIGGPACVVDAGGVCNWTIVACPA